MWSIIVEQKRITLFKGYGIEQSIKFMYVHSSQYVAVYKRDKGYKRAFEFFFFLKNRVNLFKQNKTPFVGHFT